MPLTHEDERALITLRSFPFRTPWVGLAVLSSSLPPLAWAAVAFVRGSAVVDHALVGVIALQLVAYVGLPLLASPPVARLLTVLQERGQQSAPAPLAAPSAALAQRLAAVADPRPPLRRPLTWLGLAGVPLVAAGLFSLVSAYVGPRQAPHLGAALCVAGTRLSAATSWLGSRRSLGALVTKLLRPGDVAEPV